MNNSNDNCTYSLDCHIRHNIDYYIFPSIYIIVVVISIVANSTSLYVSCLQVKKKNELGIYLFNLSFADLLYTLMLPLWVHFSLNHNDWSFSKEVCSLNSFLMHINIYSSAGFLTCISVDRYLAVVHPLKFHHLRTRKTAVIVSLGVWIIQSVLNAAILRHDETRCDRDKHLICYDIFPIENWKAKFNIIIVCIGHLIPLIVMVLCYHKIYAAVKKNQATADNDKKKIKQLILVIILSFFITFTPYNMVLLIRSIGEPCNCEFAKRMYVPYKVTLAISSLNCIADPLLYCFVSEAGRADLMTISNCCAQQSPASSKEEYKMPSISLRDSQEQL